MKILIACEYSGRTREAFRAKGHDVWSCDFLPAEDDSPFHIQGDVLPLLNQGWDMMIAHPSCTYLANSGVRWLKDNPARWEEMKKAAKFFADLFLCDIPKVVLENPVMHGHAQEIISQRLGFTLRNYTHFVQPWWFGDPFFKATGFTCKNVNPLVKPTTALTPPKPGAPEHKAWSAVHLATPGPDRWKDRSRTFPGIAQAMAEAWG